MGAAAIVGCTLRCGSAMHARAPTHLVDLHDLREDFSHLPRQRADAHACRQAAKW